jgi:hypothetical protein
MKEVVPRSHRIDENVEKLRKLAHADRHVSIRAVDLQLNLDKEIVTCLEKGLNFEPVI